MEAIIRKSVKLQNMSDSKEFDWSNEKIMIADDDIYSCLLLKNVLSKTAKFSCRKFLSKTGAKIIHAKNGKEALEILKTDRTFSIVILDIIMPYLSGLEIVRRCKTLLPDTIFIAFTADVIRYNQVRCQEEGFNLCISKPVLPVKFLNIMQEALALRGQLLEE